MKLTNYLLNPFSSMRGAQGVMVGMPQDFRKDQEENIVLESVIHRRSNASQQLHHASFCGDQISRG
jgi:hypothetical protein